MPKPGSSAKQAVLDLVHEMPEDSSYDEIVQELVFNRMVERGLGDADAGRVISDEDMKKTIDSYMDARSAMVAARDLRVHR